MNTGYFVLAIIILVFLVVKQLVKLNLLVLKIRKHSDLYKKEIKEDSDWEFIKGLY
jgi:hypothetical protein